MTLRLAAKVREFARKDRARERERRGETERGGEGGGGVDSVRRSIREMCMMQ